MNSRAADKAEKLVNDIQANGSAEQERLKEFANRAERIVREGADDLRGRADQLRGRAREYAEEFRGRASDYYDEAQDRFDVAQRYLVERVQERPIASTLAAVGVGVVLGLLLSGGRRR